MTNLSIKENSKVSIKWNVLPLDYSHEKEKEIKTLFSKKYNISDKYVSVVPNFISKDNNGNDIPMSSDVNENIQDPKFQQKLFSEYAELMETKDEHFDISKILEIDEQINSRINYEVFDTYKHYTVKWIKWDNFMSYGKDNFFDFQTLKGLVLLTSNPANQGGKTTFCLDLLRFLLFGKVTSRESDWTLSKVFNKHLANETTVNVEGCINIDGEDYVIQRTVTRPSLNKRTENSKVKNKVKYYRLINDEYIDLEDEESNDGVSVTETNKIIKESIGNERDFDLMICVSSDNLKELISLKDTERGRLISRWIGLLPLEEKDKIAREVYNKEVLPSLLSKKYNKVELSEEIKVCEDVISENKKAVKKKTKELNESKKKIESLSDSRDKMLSSRSTVDDSLMKVDVNTIEKEIEEITEVGKQKKSAKKSTMERISELSEITFDENKYNELTNVNKDLIRDIALLRGDCKVLKNEIAALKNGEYCPTCGAKLVNIDNSEQIKEKENLLNTLIEEGKEKSAKNKEVEEALTKMAETRTLFIEKSKLEILNEKYEVDLENLASRYREQKRLLSEIEKNKNAIENNNKIELAVNNLTTNINYENSIYEKLNREIVALEAEIKTNETNIEKYKKVINVILEEEKLIVNWKAYLEMVGKNGISKLIIRKVLPLVNGELNRLLTDVCDFNVEIKIDDHNDVAFYLIHDGVKSNLSSGSGFEQTVSALALRCVLSKISTFSKPSFVVFDEILGGVADENYDNVKLLFDKIANDYQMVLDITHNKNISDWHNHTIVISKENNISKISLSA